MQSLGPRLVFHVQHMRRSWLVSVGKKSQTIFIHTANIPTWIRGRLCNPSEPHPVAGALPVLTDLGYWVLNIAYVKQCATWGFLCSSGWEDLHFESLCVLSKTYYHHRL